MCGGGRGDLMMSFYLSAVTVPLPLPLGPHSYSPTVVYRGGGGGGGVSLLLNARTVCCGKVQSP